MTSVSLAICILEQSWVGFLSEASSPLFSSLDGKEMDRRWIGEAWAARLKTTREGKKQGQKRNYQG